MQSLFLSVVVFACCACAVGVRGEEKKALPGGEPLFVDSAYEEFAVSGADASRVSIAVAEGTGPGFSRVLRIRTLEAGRSFPKVGVVLKNRETLARGDVLLATFYLRTVESPGESGEGSVQFELEDGQTFSVSGQFAAHAAGEWREIQVPLRLVRDCPAGRAVINFRVGDQRQVVEVGGLTVTGYGNSVKFEELPATSVQPSYDGSEADAPWREAAKARIEQERKSDIRITVLDTEGRPVEGARVRVSQQSHAYRFGAAVRADVIAGSGPQAERYREAIKRFFSAITFENDLKWGRWINDSETPVKASRWVEENELQLRGHTMVWPTNRRLPGSLKHAGGNPEVLARVITDHITEIGKAMSPRTVVWDVVNEPFRNRDFMDLLGDAAMVDWFKAARQAAPEAKLYVNDYGIISGGGMDEQHQASYEQNVEFLLKEGAPLDGLGFQGHFGRILTPPERLLAILDRYGRFGLEMELTEYSTQIPDLVLSADYLRDVLTVFFSHPKTAGFILWGFQGGRGFKNSAMLLDRAGNLTPAGRVWLDLVFREWWTEVNTRTDAEGSVVVRGFRGRHQIEAVHAGHSVKAYVDISQGDQSAVLKLSPPNASREAATP